jgi:hypothetical protein
MPLKGERNYIRKNYKVYKMKNNSHVQIRFEQALYKENWPAIQEIVSELNALSGEEKETNRSLYVSIQDELFAIDMQIPNLDLAKYDADIQQVKIKVKNKKSAIQKENPNRASRDKSVDDLIVEFYRNSKDILIDLKYHFIFHLDNPGIAKVGLLLLTDDRFKEHPLINRLHKKNDALDPKRYEIREFLDELSKNPSLSESQYLMILVISPSLGEESDISLYLTELFKCFSKSVEICLPASGELTKGDYQARKVDQVSFLRIEKITSNLLNNKSISHEEEKVIKLCLAKNTAITDYRLLKAGFSGAKVIEVKPIRYLVSQEPVRFVIKFAEKKEGRKLYVEKEAFRRYLQELKVDGYTCNYEDTELYEAVIYNYASTDSIMDSHSFASLIEDAIHEAPQHNHDLHKTLEQLFKCAPFKKWKRMEEREAAIEKIYKEYISEDKISKAISTIDNFLDIGDVKSGIFWKQYEQIKKHVIKYNEKICHGDLHSENFFKDDKDVYLIDFGYTQEHHAIIDHCTLEMSIKFKHVPAYIKVEDLIKIDQRMVELDSFQPGFDLGFIDRQSLKKLFDLVLSIRREAVDMFVDAQNHLEYLICLFMLSFRQIQYKDMNQRYALEHARMLAEKITSFI